jgi:hypothetical protein
MIGRTKKNDGIIQVGHTSSIFGENKRSLEVYTGLEVCVPSEVHVEGYWFGYCGNS